MAGVPWWRQCWPRWRVARSAPGGSGRVHPPRLSPWPIDLNEAEGLADLLSAETELGRRSALAMAEGALSRQVDAWREGVLLLGPAGRLLDFSDEDDVADGGALLPPGFAEQATTLAAAIEVVVASACRTLARRVPRRAGGAAQCRQVHLFNALVEAEAAITAAEPGTTRDVLTRSVAIDGVPFTFADTAGLRDEGAGEIERIGIARARAEAARADLILWLGPEGKGRLMARCRCGNWPPAPTILDDRQGEATASPVGPHWRRLDALRRDLVAHARASLPAPGEAALNARQHGLLEQVHAALVAAQQEHDPLLAAEHCAWPAARSMRWLGGRGPDMLDALFGRFCIGK
jgi:tRNA modification GTPase